MDNKVLVAYASTHGSTQEVAEVIATTLRGDGLTVDLQPISKVRTLEGIGLILLGAPLYMFHWHADARRFLSRYQKALTSGLPIAIFAGGPFAKGDDAEWQEVRRQMDQEMAKFPWLKPLSVQLIGGKFDPARLCFPYNFIPALRQMPAADLRDWDAIRAWAGSLAAQVSSPTLKGQPAFA